MFWYPYSQLLLKPWALNFKATIGPVATRINEPAADVAKVQASVDTLLADMDHAAKAKLEWERLRDIYNATEARVGDEIRQFVKRVKANPHFTADDETRLQVVSTTAVADLTNYKPEITGKQTGVVIHIGFKKHGADSMNIYARLKGETSSKMVGNAKRSPYVFTPPPIAEGTSQVYEFYVMSTLSNTEMGLRSDILSVTFNG